MHIGKCVPMIALVPVLCGCKEQAEETDIRAAYREMSGCELTMKVVCGEAQPGVGCHAAMPLRPGGREHGGGDGAAGAGRGPGSASGGGLVAGIQQSVPEHRPSQRGANFPCHGAGTDAQCFAGGVAAGGKHRERQDIPCVRLALEQTGSGGGDIVTTIWLRQTDGTPVFGEIAVEGETILTAEFTSFSFCDIINETGTEQAGLPREST